jgi:hypothetical protein
MSEISVQPKKMRERLNRGIVGWLQFVRYGYTFFLEVIYQKSLARLSRACFSTARFGARAREEYLTATLGQRVGTRLDTISKHSAFGHNEGVHGRAEAAAAAAGSV